MNICIAILGGGLIKENSAWRTTGDMIAETRSGSTAAQLDALASAVESQDAERTILISNQYHLPRIALMIVNFPTLEPLRILLAGSRLLLCSAEHILIGADSARWKAEIEHAYQSAAGFVFEKNDERKGQKCLSFVLNRP